MPVAVPPIEELDRLDTADFAGAMAKVFEPNPMLLERLARRRPFRSYAALIAAARDLVGHMSDTERTALLASHPRIGAAGAMSEASRREQGHSSDAALDEDLSRLQDQYERTFGFRFVVFVNRRPRGAIVEVLGRRLTNAPAVELATAMEEYLAICAERAGVSVV